MASAQFGSDRTPEALSRACREGKPARKRPHLRLDGGALAMIDVAAWVTYHIAGDANVNICVLRHDGPKPPYHEPLTTGYATSEPWLCAAFAVKGEATGNCSTVAC
jgi:hypothetical protein